ncbi:glycylpeptide N-tetradecanoyltransferase 2-like isoform X1 [Amphibalanus amphitrite]|uniref:glycylpeptide N-tetradecanoyltransferase 2-like isoform X1 n=1 Tax=Amphibalanus amphitrite TaxID=1232801 RepID=UPI001C91AF71|nr:glycylpeptide N-tetradecanoyltransferase 2-like isoform X1 [Amphibalanus amphitrite]
MSDGFGSGGKNRLQLRLRLRVKWSGLVGLRFRLRLSTTQGVQPLFKGQHGSLHAFPRRLAALSREPGKKKDKGAPAQEKSEDTTVVSASQGNQMKNLNNLRKAMELLSVTQGREQFHQGPAKTQDEAKRKKYQFWETQPVLKIDQDAEGNEPLEGDKEVSEVRAEPYSLPDGFKWDTMNLDDPEQLNELYTLLTNNYVEDDDNMFRFDYSPKFLDWALRPPGWVTDWLCGVRVTKSNKLVGFISAIPATINIYKRTQRMVEVNFLCVHKKLRSKRVAPVLIKEITRRVNRTGIFQAVYTAGVVLPKPVGTCRYWHRSLNPKKLIEVKFSQLSRNMTMQRTLKLHRLPAETETEGFRRLTPADVPAAMKLLNDYLGQFDLAPSFDEEEFRHWFTPRPTIVDSYVVEKDGKVTDFVSFYSLPSTIMHHPTHKQLMAAYSFYNVGRSTPLLQLMRDALITAKNEGFDVFNALDLMENKSFLEPLKFGIGDGNLQYYLYNWKCPSMEPKQIGLVLQ